MKIGRQAYAEMFGPTVGDQVRLADTELWIEVERDLGFTVTTDPDDATLVQVRRELGARSAG